MNDKTPDNSNVFAFAKIKSGNTVLESKNTTVNATGKTTVKAANVTVKKDVTKVYLPLAEGTLTRITATHKTMLKKSLDKWVRLSLIENPKKMEVLSMVSYGQELTIWQKVPQFHQ